MMSMQVKPGYLNPLTTVKSSKLNPGAGKAMGQLGGTGEVRDLQVRQQQLQNTMLLMKATSADGGGISEKTEKAIEKKMEEVNTELRKAKAERNKDVYEKSGEVMPYLEKKE